MAASDLSDLKPVYLIFGAEDFLLDRAVDRLTSRLAAVADLDYNFDTFDGERAGAEAVIAAANTLPFMSERRLVIVRNTDKMPAEESGSLAEYVADPNPQTTLVLVAVKVLKNSRIYKAVDALGGVAEYRAPTKRDYPKHVVEMFSEHGRKVGMDAAEVLVRAVGYDLRRLSTEVGKVVAFTGDEKTLSRGEIEQVMSTTAPTSVYDFMDAIGRRDAREALTLLAALISEGETAYGLHPRAVSRIRELAVARALLDRGEGGVASVAHFLGRPDWQVRDLPRQAGRFTERELSEALRSAAAADAEMKTSRDPRLAFERWILSVCR